MGLVACNKLIDWLIDWLLSCIISTAGCIAINILSYLMCVLAAASASKPVIMFYTNQTNNAGDSTVVVGLEGKTVSLRCFFSGRFAFDCSLLLLSTATLCHGVQTIYVVLCRTRYYLFDVGNSLRAARVRQQPARLLQEFPTVPILAGRPDFQPMCPASRHDPHRDAYIPIFWSKMLIVCLHYCGIIQR